MREPKPYALADKTVKLLNRMAIRRFTEIRDALAVDGFDELNVYKQARVLYERLDTDNRRAYHKLARERYGEILDWLITEGLLEDGINVADAHEKRGKAREAEMSKALVEAVLSDANPVTRYVYEAEVSRKRDRVIEGVNAVFSVTGKQGELDKGLRFWSQMSQQYLDYVSNEASLQAFRDAGYEYVQWHVQDDEKVCATCLRYDKRIFKIDEIPDWPHWRCRCYCSPVKSNTVIRYGGNL